MVSTWSSAVCPRPGRRSRPRRRRQTVPPARRVADLARPRLQVAGRAPSPGAAGPLDASRTPAARTSPARAPRRPLPPRAAGRSRRAEPARPRGAERPAPRRRAGRPSRARPRAGDEGAPGAGQPTRAHPREDVVGVLTHRPRRRRGPGRAPSSWRKPLKAHLADRLEVEPGRASTPRRRGRVTITSPPPARAATTRGRVLTWRAEVVAVAVERRAVVASPMRGAAARGSSALEADRPVVERAPGRSRRP